MNFMDVAKKYKMDPLECRAMRILQHWVETSKAVFPDYKHPKPPSGDPRRSNMFKYCYKLARESDGSLPEDEYQLYVRAQLDILKHINMGNGHPLIGVHCLVGDKAWKRWKLWKRKYDSTIKIRAKAPKPKGASPKVYEALRKTSDFLRQRIGDSDAYEKLLEFESSGDIYTWINIGKISPYYLVLSPHFERLGRERKLRVINFDLDVYKAAIDDGSRDMFREMFPHEVT